MQCHLRRRSAGPGSKNIPARPASDWSVAREVFYLRGVDHAAVDASFCAGLEVPSSYQACNTAECHTSPFTWTVQGWGACDATCGGGVARRTVVCQAKNSTVDPSEAECANLTKAYVPLERPCNTQVSGSNRIRIVGNTIKRKTPNAQDTNDRDTTVLESNTNRTAYSEPQSTNEALVTTQDMNRRNGSLMY
eukprot:1209983-Pyramimonas_sp.AAC.3